jgi:hypothetical protein
MSETPSEALPVAPAIHQPAHEAMPPVLTSFQLSRTMLEKEDEEEPGPYYDVSVDEPLRAGTETIFYCQIAVGQTQSGTMSEIKATYVFGFSSPEDLASHPEFRAIVERLVKATIWLRFRDLFALTTAQGDMDFPQLPSAPDEIKFPGK